MHRSPTSLDAVFSLRNIADGLSPLPICDSLWKRLATSIGRWAQASIDQQADTRLWRTASSHTH